LTGDNSRESKSQKRLAGLAPNGASGESSRYWNIVNVI
jgi:hypothetical protein